MVTKPRIVFASLTLLIWAGCSSNSAESGGALRSLPTVRLASGHLVSQHISHVIVIVQENRSFENFFAGYPGANAPTFGCVGKGGRQLNVMRPAIQQGSGSGSGCPPSDTTVALHEVTFDGPDFHHDWKSSIAEWDNGKMDGFWKYGIKNHPYLAYAYVKHSLIKPYWTIAQHYVLADAMFPTEFGGSFTAHLTLVAGTDSIKHTPPEAEVDFPSALDDGCDSASGTTTSYLTTNREVRRFRGPFPCFTQFNTMAEVLDGGGVSWKYYAPRLMDAGLWEPFEAISYVRKGLDWSKNIITPQTQILRDPGKAKLASVTWVTPSRLDSDHPAALSDRGPSWVASIVNAIGESSYWGSSAIIVIWDDWGGWYDNAAPPQLDYRGLGMRVPCLIISPYARETSPRQPGYISHTRYEFGSILKFIEEVFNLPSIGARSAGYTDERANSLDDSFDFTQQPRPFVPIRAKYKMSRFLHEPPSDAPVDKE